MIATRLTSITILISLLTIASVGAAQPADSSGWADWAQRMRVTGTIQGEFRWLRDDPNRVAANRSSFDLYVRRVELGIETSITNWVTGEMVLYSNWVGDYRQAGDGKVGVEELQIDLHKPGGAGYLTFGFRSLPFGLFENHLISDPLLENAYEVRKVGATFGLHGPKDIDFSMSVYKGPEQMTHLFQSELFDTNLVIPFTGIPSGVSSWIGAFSASPVESTLAIFGSLCSEPGTTRRTVTADAGFRLLAPFQRSISLNFEISQALRRDLYERASREHDEGIISVTFGYSFEPRPNRILNRGLYRARREFLHSHPTELAIRYEHFSDDGLTADLHTWTVNDRLSVGGTYTIQKTGSAMAYLACELFATDFRVYNPPPPTMLSDHSYGALIRLGVDF